MQIVDFCCLSPHGESGLKLGDSAEHVLHAASLPAWGEWIEIGTAGQEGYVAASLPAWGEWIEICAF